MRRCSVLLSLLVIVGRAGIPGIVTQTRVDTALFFNTVVFAVTAATLAVSAMLGDAAITVGGAIVSAVPALVLTGTEILAIVTFGHGGFLLYMYCFYIVFNMNFMRQKRCQSSGR